MAHREQLKELLRRKSVKHGTFTLASGRESDYFIDCKLTTLDPEGAALTGYAILELLDSEGIEADAIGGPTIGADPIVAAVAAVSYLRANREKEGKPLPAFLVRKERKGHGLQQQIEGISLNENSRVVIVDEVCTTGGSTQMALDVVQAAGFRVVAVISLVDREEGGSEGLKKKYKYLPLFTAKELLEGEPQRAGESGEAAEITLQPTASDPRAT